MVLIIPEKVYTMKNKKAIIKANVSLYRKSRKKMKSLILSELVHVIKMNRNYIAYLLRNAGKRLYKGKITIIADLKSSLTYKRGRKKIYTKEVIKPLVDLWKLSGCLSSVHLVSFIKVSQPPK